MEVRDVNMDFSYGSAFAEDSPEAYERLILDVLLGEPSLFPVNAEVELSWEILDPVLDYWASARHSPTRTSRAPGARSRHSRCCNAPAGNGGDHERRLHDRRSAEHHDQRRSTSGSSRCARRVARSPWAGCCHWWWLRTPRPSWRMRSRRPSPPVASIPAASSSWCRLIRLATESRLDGQLRVGGDAGAGEVVVLRTSGPLAAHASSVVLPFLLPDTPVVAWWPGHAPAVPAEDPLGRLAIRRITDATGTDGPAGDAAQPADRIHPRRHRPGLEPASPIGGRCWPPRWTSRRTSRSPGRWCRA